MSCKKPKLKCTNSRIKGVSGQKIFRLYFAFIQNLCYNGTMDLEIIRQQQNQMIDDALAAYKSRCKVIEQEAHAKAEQNPGSLKDVLAWEKNELDGALVELTTTLNHCTQEYFHKKEDHVREQETKNLTDLEQQLNNA